VNVIAGILILWPSSGSRKALGTSSIRVAAAFEVKSVLGHKLPDNDLASHKDAAGDQDPIVREARISQGQLIESSCKVIDNCREFDDDEVGARRLSVWASIGVELIVKIVEEGWIDAYPTTLGHRSRAAALSLSEMCVSILRRACSSSSGETVLRSFSNPARMTDSRSFGLSCSNSSADQIFRAAMSQLDQARWSRRVAEQRAE